MNPIPAVPKDLLDYLQRQFPEVSPSEGETHDQLMIRCGVAKVMRFLAHTYRVQQEGDED